MHENGDMQPSTSTVYDRIEDFWINTYNFSVIQLAAYIESENLAVERKIASKAVDTFISTLERLEEQSLMTKAEAERIKQIVLDEIKLTVSDLKNAA